MNLTPWRVSVTEYTDEPGLVERLQKEIGSERGAVIDLLQQTSERLRNDLSLRHPPIEVSGNSVRVIDMAGLTKLSALVEIEVAPKFLGSSWPRWREDFFLIATLSRFGRILPSERFRTAPGERGDLASLAGRALVHLFWANYRRPLRVYRRVSWREFALDGEVDPEALLFPESDGFEQTGIVLDRANVFNERIYEAARLLLSEVREAETRRQLLRVVEVLSPQRPSLSRRRPPVRVPNRHRRWQDAYDLSLQVIQGLGLRYDESPKSLAPGYVMKTGDAWEDLVLRGIQSALPDHVVVKRAFSLGDKDGKPFKVTPDVSIMRRGEDLPFLLVDAKYKGRVERESHDVERADVYEALAFMEAVNAKRLLLAYPRLPVGAESPAEPGHMRQIVRYKVKGREVIAVEIELRGISEARGFQRFAESIRKGLTAYLPKAVVAA